MNAPERLPEHGGDVRASVIGWDIGGAHVKACLMQADVTSPEASPRAWRVHDVAQWACPLWQGKQHLEAALASARARWPQAVHGTHAVTMTGEMVDLFADRADGVQRIATVLAAQLPGVVRVFAGRDGDGRTECEPCWVRPDQAAAHWPQIASANWRATAMQVAQVLAMRMDQVDAGPPRTRAGLLIDIGSTTTDLIAFRNGRVLGHSVSDRHRLASGELVYQGVVRTPLCALAPRIALQGEVLNVMNEFFATSADAYRLTGELDPEHDLYPAADGADKGLPATRARLARMVGCDVRDASEADWLAFAHAWRDAQLDELAGQARRVLDAHGIGMAGDTPVIAASEPGATVVAAGEPGAAVVAAGCGAFLVPDLLRRLGGSGAEPPLLDYGRHISRLAPQGSREADADLMRRARLCAPSVAVATLFSAQLATRAAAGMTPERA